MKKNLTFASLAFGFIAFAQVGINTSNPQGIFNVDPAKNNATTGTPTVAQTKDDFTILSDGKVGIGTTIPTSTLDINGGLTVREIDVTATGSSVAVPSGVSQIRIIGTPGANVGLTAPTPNPTEDGFRLVVLNQITGVGNVQFSGYSIESSRGMEFIYSNGSWYTTEGGANASTNQSWKTSGNTGTDPLINFLGTNDTKDFNIRTSNTEQMKFGSDGKIYFPGILKTTPVPIPYNALGINPTTGQIGTFTAGSQPTYIVSSNVTTATIDGNTSGSRGIDFGSISQINAIGIITGQDLVTTSENYNNGNTGNVINTNIPFYYYQVQTSGTYEFRVTGTIRCATAYTDSGSYLSNMTVWKAVTGSTAYSIQDDYRVLNIIPGGGRFGYPVNQSFVLDLQAGDKISFRQYRAGSTGVWTDCSYTLPVNGAQKYSQRLTVIKL